jgi:hypothetical protein
MSLEDSITRLVASNDAMAQSMEGQAEAINVALANQQKKVESMVEDATQHFPLPMPLNANAFMVGGATGYGAVGNVAISAVHPFTKAFEGPYAATKPTSVAIRESDATQAQPYWFGVYNKGPRANRGGLGDGWQGLGSGHLLKLAKPQGGQHDYNNACVFALNKHIKLSAFIFRAYVWIESGPLSFGVGPYDSGGNVTVPSAGEWHVVNQLMRCSEVTSKNNWRIRLTSSEAQEIYIAMPNIFPVAGVGNNFTLMNVEAS